MKSVKLLFILYLLWSGCEAPPPPPGRPVPPPKRQKMDIPDFVTKFRNWDISKAGKIPSDVVAPFLGHGGTYESVQPLASKLKTIESDHAPHNSILEYVDPNNMDRLPENIQKAVKTRKELEAQLAATDYPQNEAKMKAMKPEIDDLTKKLNKPIRVNQWDNPRLQNEFNKNTKEITKTLKEINQLDAKLKATPSGDPQLQIEIANLKKSVADLQQKNNALRNEAEAKFKTPHAKARLEQLEGEYKTLENVNKDLSRALDVHNENIKKAMGVLSIPYDKHRIFPSTGSGGLDKDIRDLKNADSAKAKAAMEEYDKLWKQDIDLGIKKGYIKNADDFATVTGGKKVYDYEGLWKKNFDRVIKAVETERQDSSTSKATTGGKRKKPAAPTPAQSEQAYLTRVHLNYAKKFMTTTIYYVKTPEAGYSRLVNLYIDEYKLYMKGDFDSYKVGISQLLEANKQFGWLSDGEVNQITRHHNLQDVDMVDATDTAAVKRANEWNSVEDLVKIKSEKSSNPVIPDADPGSTSTSTSTGAASTVCTSSTRRKRSAMGAGNCVFFSKQKDSDLDLDPKNKVKPQLDDDGIPKPKIRLPSDADTVAIDSKRLTSYLNDLNGDDFDSVRTKQAVVEYASKNADKLTGTPEEIAAAKARLKQEDLDSHSEKTALGTKLLRDSGGDISAKAPTKYQRMKISASRMAAKMGKFTQASNKFSNPYGKIMLAKGVVTALRHGDYESLALMGGRIGLEVALSGVTKLGKHIAKKATTKAMTKFGSQFLGKLAGPVGAIADIGINIYSITKSVKILNDPNASKFDRNDAIADIVADSIDIAVTATAAILSLAFPPLAPVFAAVAFVVNLLTTIVVAFYKASNHVDRINEQLPLLSHEKSREYWRYMGGRDTSGYITELIDTKRANNIAVNMTVQFLKDNPDYIGRVFPSRTLYQPAASCSLEKKICGKLIHFIPLPCKDWHYVSSCSGYGGYCSGSYNSYKCQSDSATGVVIPLAGHDDVEYRCKCGDEPPPQWGYEILDSEVNFRYQQSVYLQRAAPDFEVPYGFTYQCKPSSLSNEGERVSWPWTQRAYYCKGAIGVKRSNNRGKFMLYDLGNGTDSIYLDESETVDNMFVVKDGHKKYEGNAGDDTFLLDGPCDYLRGWLDGKQFKSQGNSLVLGPNCRSWNRLEVDLQSGTMYFNGYSLELRSIQRVIGRQRKTDVFRASCGTKLIVGSGGGSKSDPDQIYLPGACSSSTEITVALEGSATVHVGSFSGGKCFVLLQERGISFKANVPPSLVSGTLLFKFQESVGKLTSARITNGGAIQLQFEGGGTASFEVSSVSRQPKGACSKTSEGNPIQILITENSQFSRQLSFMLEPPGQLQAIHVLDGGSGSRIQGYDFMDNVFHLKSGYWNVVGGRGRVNQFILKSFQFSGSIDGVSNGQNTLQISSDLSVSPIRVDLNVGELSGSQGRITAKNIQRLVGRPEYIDDVVVSCEVKYLELGGNARDIVNIPRSGCSTEIRIASKGKLTVEDNKSAGATVIEAGYFDQCSGRSGESLDLHIKNFGEGDTTLLLNFPISTLTSASPTILNVGGTGGGQVAINGDFPNIYFEEDYKIKSALIKDSGRLMAYHELKVPESFQQTSKLRKGTNAIPNIFKLENGKNWRVEGGNDADVFSLVSGAFSGSVNGLGGRNQLFIGDSIQGDVELKQSEILLSGQRVLTFQNIQEIHGRAGQSEDVEVGCDTLHIALNGGNLLKADRISIPDAFSRCNSKLSLTLLGVGFTQLSSRANAEGKVDTYLSTDANNQLQFKANIQVSPNLIFNFPIQLPSYKLSSYRLNIRRADNSKAVESVQLKIYLMDHDNFLDFTLEGGYLPQNMNWMFVDEDFNSNGNIFINTDANEIQVLHVLQKTEGDSQSKAIRRGAVGAKNVFRLHTGTWDAFGGALDDSFILNEIGFGGQIHGLQGVNSLILSDKLDASLININLSEESMIIVDKQKESHEITVKSIQIVGGRKGKKEIVNCNCDTKLIMLEGGERTEQGQDEIYIKNRPCTMEMAVTVVLQDFTRVENLARKGNFTYHMRALQSSSWDIKYSATAEASHALKLEMTLEKVKHLSIISKEEKDGIQSLEINFKDGGTKQFPVNYLRLPTFQIGTGLELMAEILYPDENMTEPSLRSSIIARTPFSGSIHGLHGVENGIVVHTSTSLEGIFGGEKDDNIFLSEVESILVVDGGEGINRLQLSDELHRGLDMEVDFQLEKIKFIETNSDFVTVVKGIDLFVGREHSFERVIVGCATRSVKWVEEVRVRNWECGYNVKIELGDSTRVMFEIANQEKDVLSDDEDPEENEIEEQETTTEEAELENYDNDDIIEEIVGEESYLEPSIFHYHFTSIRSFDIEVGTFKSLRDTRHIFYLNFALANLTSIRFSLNESRLIYSTFQDPSLEYSHLVGELEDTAMFYSQPEFMTNEGFLLRITRYGEVMAVLAAVEETFELDFIHQQVIPGLISQSERLGISFMVETAKDFIYTGSSLVEEVDLLTNRENTTSHLIGWSGTTYEILDMENDTWIYPQQNQNPDSAHVIDLTNIVSQIRSETGHKYVPEVKERGAHLQIIMTNWTDTYPASVFIANGTEHAKNLVILLNSIAMEIMPRHHESRRKRSVMDDGESESEWKIKPKPITIPKGYTYVLSPEDLEDEVEIKSEGDDVQNDTLTYARDNSDLVITSINKEENSTEEGRFTSFVIFDYYESGIQHKMEEGNNSFNDTPYGRVETISNIQINLGRETAEVSSNVPILRTDTGEEVQVQEYEDVLDIVEEEILKDVPDAPRRFKVSLSRKIGRNPVFKYLVWGGFWGITMAVGILIWVFCRKTDSEVEGDVYDVKNSQENYDKVGKDATGNETTLSFPHPKKAAFHLRSWVPSWKWVFGADGKRSTYEVNKENYGTQKSEEKQKELIPMIERTDLSRSEENIEDYDEPLLISQRSLSEFNFKNMD